MAFMNNDDFIAQHYDVHVTDDLKSPGTWEYVDLAFSHPSAKFMLVWRRDGKKFSTSETNYMTKYVRDDLEEFISEGMDSDSKWHTRILKKMVDSNSCLILAWDEFELPELYGSWLELVRENKEMVREEVKKIAKGKSLHDRKLDIYEGKMPDTLFDLGDKEKIR
jgi:hypothetical protein